jgi:hypothetical protein
MSIEEKLKLAARITSLRAELLKLEAEFAGTTPKRRERRGKGPSVSARVLNIIQEAGPAGITRRDILAVVPNDSAVHSALKAHSAAQRIHSEGGAWVFDPPGRPTRELRAVAPPEA